MLTHEENDLLCRLEGDAPMGKLMRAHWIPALLSDEVAKPDCDPVRVRVMGENLVAFRDTNGRVGVLDEQCPHRRASLFFGRNEECGLRCLYHGWKMDVAGNVLEMSSEPPESPLKEKVKHKAYPAREWGGFVWIFMGDAAAMPEFDPPPWAPTEDTPVSVAKIRVPCNWAQILEGAIDSAHSSTLHSSEMRPARVEGAMATDEYWQRPSTDKAPRMQTQTTSFGFHYAALRRPIKNSATHTYARITVYVAPFTALIPPNNKYNIANVNVPIDDENTMFHFIAWGGAEPIGQEAWCRFNHAVPGEDLDKEWRHRRQLDNNFLQDREEMRQGGSFTGIKGIPNQDIAMWVPMGTIVDRTQDTLGASDLAIVEFRRLMVDAARRVQEGGPALGTTEPRIPQATLKSFEGVIPKTTDWRTLGTAGEARIEHAA
jgi:phthalate 4,5-dioxygenase oxygenase subunit